MSGRNLRVLSKLARDAALRECVQDWLDRRWSPEQISHMLRREFPDNPERHLAHETIYQAIYRPTCQPRREHDRADDDQAGAPFGSQAATWDVGKPSCHEPRSQRSPGRTARGMIAPGCFRGT